MKRLIASLPLILSACAIENKVPPVVPSLRYSDNIREQTAESAHARIRPVAAHDMAKFARGDVGSLVPTLRAVSHETDSAEPKFETYESSMRDTREYQGPLSVGDPGVTSSLWRESRTTNELFRDHRAFNPMDLITIVVSESAEGKKSADTEIKESSSLTAAITSFLGLDSRLKNSPYGKETGIDPGALVDAETTNNFKGEGKTNRKDTLTAKISAMVAEVLPSGILRIEGEKIISVNAEEQVMVISGLVRPRDINSANEINSSQIANMRIDYYGRGTVGEAQNGAWLGRLFRWIWPF